MYREFSEIRELLNTDKLDDLFGEGATEKEVADCEQQLGLRFPPSYRSFLREFGWGYFGSLELIAGLGPDIPPEWDRGANVLHVVIDERQGPLHIPKDVVSFCQNGAGDWYALDCSRINCEESPVVFIANEQVAAGKYVTTKCANSFGDWIFEKLSQDS